MTTVLCEDWNRRYATPEFIWGREACSVLVAEASALAPGRALDLAAGEGRNSIWLAEQGWQVDAVDFAAAAIEKGQQWAQARQVARRIRFEAADLRHYGMARGRYDLVLICYLQIPWRELQPVLVRAAGAVAPGGTLLLVGHDRSNLLQGHGGPKDPAVLYTSAEVAAAVGDSLRIVKAGRVERPVRTEQGVKIALDCLVCAQRPQGARLAPRDSCAADAYPLNAIGWGSGGWPWI